MAGLLFNNVFRQPRRARTYRFKDSPIHEYTDSELRLRYRFGRESIIYITNLINDDLERKTRRNHALRPIDQVLIALRFYACGSFLQVIGDTFGVDKATVSRVVFNVTQSLIARRNEFVKWPSNEELREIKSVFYQRGGFPGVIGCVDCSHIRIQAPHEHEKAYVNRKNYHSINVQGVCDHKGMFTSLVARWPGSAHDSHIFRNSNIYDHLQRNHQSLEDGILIGDTGYACSMFLMTPYSKPCNPAQEAYNKALRKTRVIIEQTFGRWKRRFHVLHSEIRMHPERVCAIVGACAVLHNVAIIRNEPIEDGDDYDDSPALDPYYGPENGLTLRTHICNTFFA